LSPLYQVKLLGREYSLRSEQSEQQLARAVRLVEDMLAETARVRSADTRDLAALTLLNLAGQYLQMKENQQQQAGLDERLQALLDRLEQEGVPLD
jgi:cell division protein ZapA